MQPKKNNLKSRQVNLRQKKERYVKLNEANEKQNNEI